MRGKGACDNADKDTEQTLVQDTAFDQEPCLVGPSTALVQIAKKQSVRLPGGPMQKQVQASACQHMVTWVVL